MFCPSCASYSNRKKALHDDMSKYICCAGHCPCSGKMKEKDCPEFCLCLEVTFPPLRAHLCFLVLGSLCDRPPGLGL